MSGITSYYDDSLNCHPISIYELVIFLDNILIYFHDVLQWSLLGGGGCVLRLLRHAGHSSVPLRVLLDHLLRGPDGLPGGDVLHDGLEDGHHQQEEAELDDRGRLQQHQQGQNQEGGPQNVR